MPQWLIFYHLFFPLYFLQLSFPFVRPLTPSLLLKYRFVLLGSRQDAPYVVKLACCNLCTLNRFICSLHHCTEVRVLLAHSCLKLVIMIIGYYYILVSINISTIPHGLITMTGPIHGYSSQGWVH